MLDRLSFDAGQQAGLPLWNRVPATNTLLQITGCVLPILHLSGACDEIPCQ